MIKTILISASLLFANNLFSQSLNAKTQNVLRLNFINPGIEYEYAIGHKSTLSANIGYGISMSYPEVTEIQKSHAFFLSSFVDLQYKNFFDMDKRLAENKNIVGNSGNFWSIKFNGRGKNYGSDIAREGNVDFTVGPTWGIQRNYKKLNLLFDAGPVCYFNTERIGGFYPLMLEFNLGYNLLSH